MVKTTYRAAVAALVAGATWMASAQAAWVNYSFDLTVTSLGDPTYGEVDTGDIALGDIFTVSFSLNDEALPFEVTQSGSFPRASWSGIGNGQSLYQNFSLTPGANNTGTYVPAYEGLWYPAIVAQAYNGTTRIVFSLSIDEGNSVDYTAEGGVTGQARFYQMSLVFNTGQAWDAAATTSTPLSAFLATPASEWTTESAEMSFEDPEDYYPVVQGTMTAVPEPGTVGLVALAGLGLMALRRRMRS